MVRTELSLVSIHPALAGLTIWVGVEDEAY
jgi:hypothetical protein